MVTPTRENASTKAPIGAREPKSTAVPAQSRMSAFSISVSSFSDLILRCERSEPRRMFIWVGILRGRPLAGTSG